MTLPSSVTTITVTGQNLCDASGAPYYGTVTFTPANMERSSTGPGIIGTTPVVQTVTAGVMQSVVLPTNDANIHPGNSYYEINYKLTYAAGDYIALNQKYAVQLLSTMGTAVDLGALTPLTTLPILT